MKNVWNSNSNWAESEDRRIIKNEKKTLWVKMWWKEGFCVAIRFLIIWIPIDENNNNQRLIEIFTFCIFIIALRSESNWLWSDARAQYHLYFLQYICNFMNFIIIILTQNNVACSAFCWNHFYRHAVCSIAVVLLFGELGENKRNVHFWRLPFAVCR